MDTNGAQQNPQQPTARIAGLFHTKAQQANAVLGTIGKSLGNPLSLPANQNTFQRKQVFTNGEIAEKGDNAQSLADLAISYKPFSDFIINSGHHWLGDIIEDFYSAKNGGGKSIVVQRYKNGVIWWDGQGSPNVLSWTDWNAIAGLGNKLARALPFKLTSFLPRFDRIAWQVGRVTIVVICLCVIVFILHAIW